VATYKKIKKCHPMLRNEASTESKKLNIQVQKVYLLKNKLQGNREQ